MTLTYTTAEIQRQNAQGKILVCMDGKVYDLTKFAHDHPGGKDIIEEMSGEDATDAFKDAGHPKSAIKEREQYCVGIYQK
ncbi:cytochrome b5-like heme/steroid binding domain-containing protein [Syncephalis plumigaleata]|nr:cytochrome b5-like heme/steroid binding domain-containing protein [Syncephalis plumigaleata]